jgi:hypothetical protein
MQDEEVVNKFTRCDRLARRICTGYSHEAGLEPFISRHGGATNATRETSFEAQAYFEIRSGVRCRRIDVFTSGRRIRSSRADDRFGEFAGPRTGSSIHARRGRNRRRQPGDVLRVRQGKYGVRQRRHAGHMGARLRRLSWLSRLPWLPCLPWLWRLRRRRLLRFVGSLPLLLKQATFRLL